MNQPHSWTALITVAALLMYIALALKVARERARSGVQPPAMTGDPALERALRVHLNTGEWLAPFLAGLWLFSIYWNDRLGALIGLVWVIGRFAYAFGYWRAAKARLPGFAIQFTATMVLLIGGAAGAVRVLIMTGGL